MSLNVEADIISMYFEDLNNANREYRHADTALQLGSPYKKHELLEHENREAASRLEYAFKAFAEAVRTVDVS